MINSRYISRSPTDPQWSASALCDIIPFVYPVQCNVDFHCYAVGAPQGRQSSAKGIPVSWNLRVIQCLVREPDGVVCEYFREFDAAALISDDHVWESCGQHFAYTPKEPLLGTGYTVGAMNCPIHLILLPYLVRRQIPARTVGARCPERTSARASSSSASLVGDFDSRCRRSRSRFTIRLLPPSVQTSTHRTDPRMAVP